MFQWSNKTNKTVSFNQEVTDQTLLTAIENELAKKPHKTFSDLCKEALWHLLCVPESLRPSPKIGEIEQQIEALLRQVNDLEERLNQQALARVPVQQSQPASQVSERLDQQMTEMQRQLMALEQRLASKEKESGRLDTLESLVQQMKQQMAQAAPAPNHRQTVTPTPPSTPPMAQKPAPQPVKAEAGQGEDPLLERLGGLFDDF